VKIQDEISGHGAHMVSIYWHFHPDIKIDRMNRQQFIFSGNSVIKGRMICPEDYAASLDSTSYAPEFGKMITNSTIRVEKKVQLPVTITTVFEFMQ
jgi:hypothetical protein